MQLQAKERVPVRRLSATEQRQFDYYFYQAISEKDGGQYDEALETLGLCLALDSLNADAHQQIGLLYSYTGFKNMALRHLELSVKLSPDNWWYNIQLINLLSDLKRWKRAVEVAVKLKKLYPQKEEVYTMLSALYKQTQEFKKAIAEFNKLEKINGITEATSFEKIALYFQLKQNKKAISEIDKLIKKFPSEMRFQILRGDIYLQQNKAEKAFVIYQKVIAVDPRNAYVYVSLSDYYDKQKQPEKAIESIVNALKSDQLDVDTKMQVLGQYVTKIGQDTAKLVETETLFKLLVERYPLEEAVHGYYASFLQFQKRNAEAASEFETMLIINPKNEKPWFELIQESLIADNYTKLLDITNRAIEQLPTNALLYYYKSIAHVRQTEWAAALQSTKTGLTHLTPEQAALKSDFYSQMADIYYGQAQRDSAFVAYELSLQANPKNMMVMNNYAYYLSLEKKDLKKAEKMSAKTVELEPKNSTYLDTYAWILYQQANYSLAKFYIERALDNLPKGAERGVILDHYGDILLMLNEDAKALEAWQKAYDEGLKTEELKMKIDNKGYKQ